jgi:hypothetical protein
MANKCIICGKYCKSGQIAHSKCLNTSDVVLERAIKKGGFAKKRGLTPVQRARKVYGLKGKRRWCPANFPESYMPLKKIKKK